MIGRDLYNYKTTDATYNFDYLTAYYPHKMIALSECGYSGGTSPYMSEQWEAGAKWSFGMPWYHYQYKLGGNHQYANDDWWKAWFNQDYTLTLDDMKTLRDQYLSGSGIVTTETTLPEEPADPIWHTLQGIRIPHPTTPGLYIKNGKKVVVN